ncbi:MAG: helix-turn-helix domain-containing protein [Actinomycetes bacterium]
MYDVLAGLVIEGRDQLGLSQGDLAVKLGVRQQTISRWETGTSRPQLAMVPVLASALEIRDARKLYLASNYDVPQVRLPVRPMLTQLPLDNLTPGDFENFCCDLFQLLLPRAQVSRFGGAGHKQDGIDLVAELQDGTRYAYQCKRHQTFGPAAVAAAAEAADFPASRHHLLLSRTASPEARKAVARLDCWFLYDREDLSRMVRQELNQDDARRLVDSYFPGWRKELLGIEEPGIWLTAAEYFAPTMRAGAALSHRWSLVGRHDALRVSEQFIGSAQTVMLISGSGGSGKSRFLLRLSEQFRELVPDEAVRFLARDMPISAKEIEALPPSCVIVIDDAHDREDLGVLFANLGRLAPGARLVIATRPYALAELTYTLKGLGLVSVDDEDPLILGSLAEEDAELLATEVMSTYGAGAEGASNVAWATRDCPMFTVIASELVAKGVINPAQLLNDPRARADMMRVFRDEIVGNLGDLADRKALRDLIELIALLQPIGLSDNDFGEAAKELVGAPIDKIRRNIRSLQQLGLLSERANALRVVPDLLADCLVAEACVDSPGNSGTGYASRVMDVASGPLTQNLIINLGRLDWRTRDGVSLGGGPLDEVWSRFRVQVENGDSFAQAAQLRNLSQVAPFQPMRAIELVDAVIKNRGLTEPGADIFLLRSVSVLLRGVAQDIEFLGPAADRLWQLGSSWEGRLNSDPDHAIRILQDLVSFDSRRPIEFIDRVVERAGVWLEAPAVTGYIHSPLDVVEGVLATEGTYSVADGWNLKLKPFGVRVDVVRPTRDRVINLALNLLGQPNLRLACRAADVLGNGLRYPMGYFGRQVESGERDAWTPEILSLLSRIRDFLQTAQIDPIVHEVIRKQLAWQQAFGESACQITASEATAAIGDTPNSQLTRALVHGWAHTLSRFSDDPPDYQAAETSWRAQQCEVVHCLLRNETEPDQIVDLIGERLTAIGESQQANSEPGPFLHILFSESSAAAVEMLTRVVGDPGGVFTRFAYIAIAAVRAQDRDVGLRLASEFSDHPDPRVVRQAARVFAPVNGPDLSAGEVDLLRELSRSSDEDVRFLIAVGLHLGRGLKRSDRIGLILDLNIGGSSRIAGELLGAFGRHSELGLEDLDHSQIQQLLDQLVELHSISDHGISDFFSKLSAEDPDSAITLLCKRIATACQDAVVGSIVAIPIEWEMGSTLQFRKRDDFPEIVRRTRDWAAEHHGNPHYAWWAPKLFAVVVGTFDDVVFDILAEVVAAPVPAQVITCGALVRSAPSSFAWTRVEWVVNLINAADRLGEACLNSVAGELHGAVISGMKTGSPGEPFPADIEQRDRAYEIAARHSAGTAPHRFYMNLARSAERVINDDMQWDELDFRSRSAPRSPDESRPP